MNLKSNKSYSVSRKILEDEGDRFKNSSHEPAYKYLLELGFQACETYDFSGEHPEIFYVHWDRKIILQAEPGSTQVEYCKGSLAELSSEEESHLDDLLS